MKKCFALILALVLLMASALAEEDAVVVDADVLPDPSGDWFGDANGFPMRLTLNGDGAYALSSSAAPGEPQAGLWEYRDGFVWLDGDEDAPLNLTAMLLVADDEAREPAEEEILTWTALNVIFRRQAAPAYVPADIDPAAALDALAGYWKCAFVDAGGAPVSAAALGDNTDVYIEGETVALGGDMFGDVYIDFTFADGELSVDIDGSLLIAIALQRDGVLRMTLTQADDGMTLYLFPAESALDKAG